MFYSNTIFSLIKINKISNTNFQECMAMLGGVKREDVIPQ